MNKYRQAFITLPHDCVCPNPGLGFQSSYVLVFSKFNDLRWEGVIDIDDAFHILLYLINDEIMTELAFLVTELSFHVTEVLNYTINL